MFNKKTIVAVIVGIFLSVFVGLTLFIVGSATSEFTFCYIGMGVIIGGTLLTGGIFTAVTIFKVMRSHRNDFNSETPSPSTTIPYVEERERKVEDLDGQLQQVSESGLKGTENILKEMRKAKHEIGRYDVSEPQTKTAKLNKTRTFDDVITRENAFLEELEKSGRTEILQSYKAEADPVWEKYAGDTWDENLQKIDELLDKYGAEK